MEDLSLGAVTAIAILAIIVLSTIYNMSRRRSRLDTGAGSSGQTDTVSGGSVDGAGAVMSANGSHSRSDAAFQEHPADHTTEQIGDVPVYALVHLITASLNSPSRVKWLESVVATVLPRGADPELIDSAEHFWDLNERWTFKATCVDDFCAQYLIACKDNWSAEVRERIVLAGLAALASSDFNGTYSGVDYDRVVGEFRTALEKVSADYFGTLAGESVFALDSRARVLAPQICANVA
jgi:hypothetical protein